MKHHLPLDFPRHGGQDFRLLDVSFSVTVLVEHLEASSQLVRQLAVLDVLLQLPDFVQELQTRRFLRDDQLHDVDLKQNDILFVFALTCPVWYSPIRNIITIRDKIQLNMMYSLVPLFTGFIPKAALLMICRAL